MTSVAHSNRFRPARLADGQANSPYQDKGVLIMGKYVLGWILGVPVIVLVVIYMIFN